MEGKKANIWQLIAGIIFLSGAVYIWGGVGLNPETVEYLIAGCKAEDFWFLFGRYFTFGFISLALGMTILYFTSFKLPLDFFNFNYIFLLIVFILTFFPPQWLGYGALGIALCILAVWQNLSGLLGIYLISSNLALLWGEKSHLPKLRIKVKKSIWLILMGAVFFLICALINKLILGGVPHIGDELVQYWQSKFYAQGHFSIPAPDPIEFFFDIFLFIRNGQWFSQYPPGYALMLVPGVVIGQPGLINPLLSGLTLILIGLILQELNLSRWWVLLFLLSPFVLIMSSSMMSHPAALFWGTAGLWFFLKAQREKPGLLFLWGLCAGLMFSTRPFTAVCFNLPLALFALRKRVGLGILTAGLGAILGSLPYFISNYFTTGSIFSVGYQAAWDGYSGLFFGASPWGPPHTPQFGVVHLATLLYGLNSYLFQIPLPALIGVVLWLMFQKNKNWKEWMVLSAGLCEIGGYYFYFYVDMAYGPRFAYCSVVPLLLISASGLKGFYRYLRDKGISKEMLQKSFFLASIILLALWGTISLPAQESYYFHRYSDVDPDFGKFIEANRISNALVFLDDYPSTDRHARLYSLGFSNRQAWFYSWRLSDEAIKLALKGVGIEAEDGYGAILSVPSLARALNQFWGDMRYLPSPREDMDRPYIPLKQGYIYMSPYIERNDIIYARNLGRHNEKLMEKFPQRRYYRVELTKKGYILSEIRSEIK